MNLFCLLPEVGVTNSLDLDSIRGRRGVLGVVKRSDLSGVAVRGSESDRECRLEPPGGVKEP